MREALIRSGVKNLTEFGYPSVTVDNILTDTVYSIFFEDMLKNNLGANKEADKHIEKLLAEIKEFEL